MDFFGIGGWEIFLILVVILIVAGPGKLPEIARSIGRTIRAIRKAGSDFTTTVTRELDVVQQEKVTPPPEKESDKASHARSGKKAADRRPTPSGGRPGKQ